MLKSRATILTVAAAAVMLLSATFAFADNICFEGEGSGACGELHPWATWQGYITEAVQPVFSGTWQSGYYTGTMSATASYNETYDYYFVSNGFWICTQQPGLYGSWTGYFKVTADTAYGFWWSYNNGCNGSFWGNCGE